MSEPADFPAALVVPQLLTIAQVGVVLGCSPDTVRRRIADGSLPGVVEHGRTKVRGDDLRAYVDALERVGPASGVRRTRAPKSRASFGFLRE